MDITKAAPFYNASGVPEQVDPFSEKSRFAVDRIRKYLGQGISPNDRVLDLGCGAGRFTFELEKMGAVATGIDCADQIIAHAQKAARERNCRCSFVAGDYARLEEYFEAASFDACLLPLNLGEISYSDAAGISRQLQRILVTSGRFLIEMLDDVERYVCGSKSPNGYDPSKGRMKALYTIPEHGTFEMDYFFWTVAFAKEVIGQYLEFSEEYCIERGRYWLVFTNTRHCTSNLGL